MSGIPISELDIRLMRDEDIEPLVVLWERTRWDSQPWLERRMDYSHEQNARHFREVVAVENDVWIASRRGTLVGFLAIRDDHIDQLYVDPCHQGLGVGTLLLRKARELSPARLTLFTHVRNQHARAFYRSRGFRAVGFGMSPPPESEPDVRYEWTPFSEREIN